MVSVDVELTKRKANPTVMVSHRASALRAKDYKSYIQTIKNERFHIMKTVVSLGVLLLIGSLPVHVESVCYCPWNCEEGGHCHWRVAMCIDQEAASECQKANWEIEDMLESMSSLIGIFLE